MYEATLRDLDSLADVVHGDEVGEAAVYPCADLVWRETTGRSYEELCKAVLRFGPVPTEPSGQAWNFDDDNEVRRRFPRLARLYLERAGAGEQNE